MEAALVRTVNVVVSGCVHSWRFCGGRRKGSHQSAMGLTAAAAAVVLLCALHGLGNIGGVEGAEGLFVFGDSYTDTGEKVGPPYGMTWPGPGAWGNRSCDGRNQVDYLAELFGVPSPTPGEYLDANNSNNGGINFGVGGAGVTYAYGYRPLDVQVDAFEGLVKAGLWTTEHLRKSVALVSLGINDYTSYNRKGAPQGVATLITTVVDGIALNLLRIQMLGVRHIMVASVVPGTCMPYSTLSVNNSTGCIQNATIAHETTQNNHLLKDRVRLLNKGIHGADIIIVNMTKAFHELFHHAHKYGFVDPYKSCCTGTCGSSNTSEWAVCTYPSKSIIFDGIHPTQAAWKIMVHLYASVPGYTALGPKLNTWKRKHHL